MSSMQALIRAYKILTDSRCFDHSCLEKMRMISADDNGCVCEMTVEEHHLNRSGTLHGGCTATIVDVVSSMAAIVPPPHFMGVSVDLSVSYMSGVNLGEAIVIEAKNAKIGKRLAFLEVAIRRKSDGQLVATGRHTKHVSLQTDKSLL